MEAKINPMKVILLVLWLVLVFVWIILIYHELYLWSTVTTIAILGVTNLLGSKGNYY
jgi:hypothetical protein